MELLDYEEKYGILEYQVYVIIGFGTTYNIKYFKVIYSKINAFYEYNTIFNIKKYNFKSGDYRKVDIANGKCLLNCYNSDFGFVKFIGLNTIFDILYIRFCFYIDIINIYCDKKNYQPINISIYEKKCKVIKYKKTSKLNKLKYYTESVLW